MRGVRLLEELGRIGLGSALFFLFFFTEVRGTFFFTEVRGTCRKQFCLFWLPRAVDV
jgi:hypothetical protein